MLKSIRLPVHVAKVTVALSKEWHWIQDWALPTATLRRPKPQDLYIAAVTARYDHLLGQGDIDVKPDITELFRLVLSNKAGARELESHQGSSRSSLHVWKCHRQDKGDESSPMAWSPVSLVSSLAKRYYAHLHACRANSQDGSKRNIADHYDLSNNMFKMFLSKDMTYSAGIFDKEVEAMKARKSGDFLELAQMKKLDRMLDLIDLEDGDKVLEIGCGWGSMAIRAAQRCANLSWAAITLSQEQLTLAEERIAAAGFSNRIKVVFCDYRDAASKFGSGAFSKVVSCEMIEAVGHEYLPAYFAAIDECLKPGGKASIQAICVPDARYESYRVGSDFIRERIFPGSNLVSLKEIERACEKGRTALVEAAPPFSVGLDYAKTLHEWRRRFAAHEKDIRAEVSTFGKGFDDKFIRQWHYYFAYCEVGFEVGHIDDWQVCLQKRLQSDVGKTSKKRKERSFDGDALHASNAGLLSSGWRALKRPKTTCIQMCVASAQRLLDRGLMPDWLTRATWFAL